MKEMDNNKKELKESRLMEVTGGAGETDLVPVDEEKSTKFALKPGFEILECAVCGKEVICPVGLFPKGYRHVCPRHSK